MSTYALVLYIKRTIAEICFVCKASFVCKSWVTSTAKRENPVTKYAGVKSYCMKAMIMLILVRRVDVL